MEASALVALIGGIVGAINILSLVYLSFKKAPKEIKKLDAEGESEIIDAAHTSLEGAKISSDMLKERIDELKKDIECERQERHDDKIYFTRRIKEIEAEARDYRLWAARLAKQVIEKGGIPVPFISSSDIDPLITTIDKERDELGLTKGKKEEELKNVKSSSKTI